jgi:hypothetical protein
MWMRKKNRNRLIWFVLVLLAVIMWRGIGKTTKNDFDCEFKLIYALCTPKDDATELPSLWNILKAGVTF